MTSSNPVQNAELEAMRAAAAEVAAAFGPPSSAPITRQPEVQAADIMADAAATFNKAEVASAPSQLQDLRKQMEAEAAEAAEAAAAANTVKSAKPVQAVGTITVSYRSPTDGVVRDAAVSARVLIKTDERMILHRLARVILAAPWELSSPAAREEAYLQAMCQMQWDEDDAVPAWFKAAYHTDTVFAAALAEEVAALQDAYFQGHNRSGQVETSRRFVVKRTA